MALVDLHTHILPGIDDGSRSVEMSLELLHMDMSQNVDTVVFTPHFYPWKDRPERFFEKREHAWEKLSDALPEEHPDFHRGAEFAWFDGISRTQDVFDFRISLLDLFHHTGVQCISKLCCHLRPWIDFNL